MESIFKHIQKQQAANRTKARTKVAADRRRATIKLDAFELARFTLKEELEELNELNNSEKKLVRELKLELEKVAEGDAFNEIKDMVNELKDKIGEADELVTARIGKSALLGGVPSSQAAADSATSSESPSRSPITPDH